MPRHASPQHPSSRKRIPYLPSTSLAFVVFISGCGAEAPDDTTARSDGGSYYDEVAGDEDYAELQDKALSGAKIRNEETGLCIQRSGSLVVGDGYEVYQGACDGDSPGLSWRTQCNSGICKYVTGTDTEYCLKASNSLKTSGGSYNVYAGPCSSDKNQSWSAVDLGSGRLQLKNAETGRCAYASESETTANGQYQIVQRSCESSGKYQFKVLSAGVSGDTVDASTLDRKVMTGYQGWFFTDSDGSGRGFRHWARAKPTASNVLFDMWPDLREYSSSELTATSFKYADGKTAGLYSAYNPTTVKRHLRWMKDYGIDGAFVQRFIATAVASPEVRDRVLDNVRVGAEAYGRVFANMYDISGGDESTLVEDIKRDWQHLVDDERITESSAYLRHKGRPVLAIWGFGFSDRPGTPSQLRALAEWLTRTAPERYRVTLVGGVNDDWRTHSSDWQSAYRYFSVISPWAVSRYADDSGADNFRKNKIEPDLAECKRRSTDYMPVIFPGFSWYNLKEGSSPFNKVPRRGGRFYWRQMYNAIAAGSTMVYVAMFDEVDEGTAIFKVAENKSQLPTSGKFLSLDADGEKLPSDWYLKLTGEGARMLRGKRSLTSSIPITP